MFHHFNTNDIIVLRRLILAQIIDRASTETCSLTVFPGQRDDLIVDVDTCVASYSPSAYQFTGGHWRVKESDLKKFLSKCRVVKKTKKKAVKSKSRKR